MGAVRKSAGYVAAVAALLGIVVAQPAAAESPRNTPCIQGDGVDSRVRFGLSVSAVLPWCTKVKSGAKWATGVGWLVAKTWEAMPVGYEPAGTTPLDDFKAKFESFRVYVDEGTPHEFMVEWPNGPKLWVGTFGPFDLIAPITLGTIRPLSVGSHTARRAFVFNATTCDGISSDPEVSCVPAGEFDAGTIAFTVAP